MSVEREMVRVHDAITELVAEFRSEAYPLTLMRMDYHLELIRQAGIRLIDARIESQLYEAET